MTNINDIYNKVKSSGLVPLQTGKLYLMGLNVIRVDKITKKHVHVTRLNEHCNEPNISYTLERFEGQCSYLISEDDYKRALELYEPIETYNVFKGLGQAVALELNRLKHLS